MHVLSLFVVDQFKYHVKRLELFKIRRYIKCPLLLLLLSGNLGNASKLVSEIASHREENVENDLWSDVEG